MANWDVLISDAVLRWRWPLFWIGVILAALASWPATKLEYDRSIENMFSPGDPLLVPHRHLEEIFRGNEVVLCVYDDPNLMHLDESGMQRLANIRRALEKVAGVRGVLSIEMPVGNKVVNDENFVHGQLRKVFEGYTHGSDGRTACVACILDSSSEAKAIREQTIVELRRIMANLPDGLAPGKITGEPVMVHDAFECIDRDGDRLFWATTICLGLVIFWFVRSLKWVLIPLMVVQLSLVLTKGLAGILNLRISMVSSMLTAVVTVVGIGAVMHIVVHYRQALSDGKGAWRALVQTSHSLAAPIFWACLTDASGFASLLIAYVGPVREFGMMMAIGSSMVLLSIALLVPTLTLFGSKDEGATVFDDRFVSEPLMRLLHFMDANAKTLAIVSSAFAAFALIGTYWLEIESDFTRNFRASTDIVKSYEIVESHLGGAGVCDIILPAPEELDWKYLRSVLVLEQALRKQVVVAGRNGDEPALTKVVSMADLIYEAAPTNLARIRGRRQQLLINTGLKSMRKNLPEFFDALYTVDPNDPAKSWFRVMLRARERQPSQQKLEIIEQIKTVTKKHFPEAEITGHFILLANLIDSLLSDQWRSFIVSIVAIVIIMLLALRDVRLVLIAMVPNIIPITMVMGLMGWAGLELNMGAAMIAAVSIGLSIDGSIHYLIEFVRARRTGHSVPACIDQVQESVGKSMVYSTFALMAGFLVLAVSDFVPTVYFGILMSASLLFTLIGTLLWLPMLLKFVIRDPSRVSLPAAASASSS